MSLELEQLFEKDAELLNVTIHISADADCTLLCDKKQIGELKAGEPVKFLLEPSEHTLAFISKSTPSVKKTKKVSLSLGDEGKTIEMKGLVAHDTEVIGPKITSSNSSKEDSTLSSSNKVIVEGKQTTDKKCLNEPLMQLKSISYTNVSDYEIRFNLTVDINAISNVYVFLSFFHLKTKEPVWCSGGVTQFGDNNVINNEKQANTPKKISFSFDFSNSELTGLGDENIKVGLGIILSRNGSTTKILDDDVIYQYKLSLRHIHHVFKHDEWFATSLK